MPNFTTEELIQYLYKETSKNQSQALEKAIQSDWELQERLEILKDSVQTLDKIVESPRSQSIKAILNYARKTEEVAQP